MCFHRISLIVLLLLYNSLLYCQEIGIKHYSKKHQLERLYLPGEEMKSAYFDILFPDSVYSFGSVEIKKATLETSKPFLLKYTIQNNQIHSLTLTSNRKKNIPILTSVLNKSIPKFKNLVPDKPHLIELNGDTFNLIYSYNSRSFYLKIERQKKE